jgi:hypothetical protein
MKTKEDSIKLRNQIRDIKFQVTDVIDKYCTDNNFKISYNVINSALLEILSSNMVYERSLKD